MGCRCTRIFRRLICRYHSCSRWLSSNPSRLRFFCWCFPAHHLDHVVKRRLLCRNHGISRRNPISIRVLFSWIPGQYFDTVGGSFNDLPSVACHLRSLLSLASLARVASIKGISSCLIDGLGVCKDHSGTSRVPDYHFRKTSAVPRTSGDGGFHARHLQAFSRRGRSAGSKSRRHVSSR